MSTVFAAKGEECDSIQNPSLMEFEYITHTKILVHAESAFRLGLQNLLQHAVFFTHQSSQKILVRIFYKIAVTRLYCESFSIFIKFHVGTESFSDTREIF